MQWLWMVKVTYSWVGINPVWMSRSVSTVLFHGQNATGQVRVFSIDRLLLWYVVLIACRQLEYIYYNINHWPLTGDYLKERNHTSTPPYTFVTCSGNFTFLTLRSLPVRISVVLSVTIFLQLQSVCSYIFSINCIFHSNYSVCFYRHFYALLEIKLLMSLSTVTDVGFIKR